MTSAITYVDYVMDVWRALPEHGSLALSRKDEVLDTAVDDLAAWLEQHGGKATKRTLLLAKVAKVRTAGELSSLLDRYEQVYPGSVREERTGTRGPKGIMVYAPRRDHAQRPANTGGLSSETVDGNSFPDRDIPDPQTRQAGHSDASPPEPTVAAGNSKSGNSYEATVTGTLGDDGDGDGVW